ncbi:MULTISPECIES: MarR family transcriptional regulator [Eubacterium]|jgi:DNA-binding MarR family transcriptional regulator|uniref:DNA-binding transcriptional regulator, MarR family n=1 Tax=Eubacterium ruminantium TaxID=42322 RepID=A0A1T4K533_9FIRM|nr:MULTISPECIES: MarR family transcriptional regulator [Eubacterium]MCR5367212.1 MarR family transcriptional regulator [Eubacterium sp.]SCW27645.1 DNA-binding transcriptional regulator, MarR family [Eubacterium ruminantium]SJZ37531.1 DNA-binding transcriptional regulator, MarR family [Eubacterium ruminantium]
MSNPLSEVYGKFRVHYYRDVFNRIQARELSLSAVEVYCVEIIKALNKPTINEFANFINISSPNATYKVNSLIQKGYVVKVQSETDKREYYLDVTEKFYKYWNLSEKYLDIVEKRLEENLTAEEFETFNSILKKISNEMMPEVGLPERE